MQERLAKLVGGVAVIKVGAATETEMKYVKMKIEDAVEATKAAVEEGIVAGGGTALLKANAIVAKEFADGKIKTPKEFSKEYEVGFEILLRAIEEPLRQIVANAGKHEGPSSPTTSKRKSPKTALPISVTTPVPTPSSPICSKRE